jgi:hypothetical protein
MLPQLQADEKRRDRELSLLDRPQDVATARAKQAKDFREAAEAPVKALELETDVVNRRMLQPNTESRELERAALQAMKARGEKQAEFARAEAAFAEQALRAYEARKDLESGK